MTTWKDIARNVYEDLKKIDREGNLPFPLAPRWKSAVNSRRHLDLLEYIDALHDVKRDLLMFGRQPTATKERMQTVAKQIDAIIDELVKPLAPKSRKS